jgi:hypothetical protein
MNFSSADEWPCNTVVHVVHMLLWMDDEKATFHEKQAQLAALYSAPTSRHKL